MPGKYGTLDEVIDDLTSVGSKSRKAPELLSGKITESGFLDASETWLGAGSKEATPGRWVSKDGMRQVRYGTHESTSKTHHGHFESYDKPASQGGKVSQNAVVEITNDP